MGSRGRKVDYDLMITIFGTEGIKGCDIECTTTTASDDIGHERGLSSEIKKSCSARLIESADSVL